MFKRSTLPNLFHPMQKKSKAQENMTNDGIHPVDLNLPKNKTPAKLVRSSLGNARTIKQHVGAKYAIGSSSEDQKIYYKDDLGIFPCVYKAWENHWNLRTTPEDWWFTVSCRIAKAIDKEAKSGNKKVRELFVNHEGKKNLCVDVDVFNIYEVDCESFFSQMATAIQGEIKIPEYASAMQNDFSSSSTTHKISSQINLMASMQEFFSYEMGICGCGIRGVEMYGTQEDWEKLLLKFQNLQKQLDPILRDLKFYLGFDWFEHVEFVLRKLGETYSKGGSKEVCDFWADIFMVGKGWKYGPSGFGGHEVEEYNGWLIQFLTGRDKILVEEFFNRRNTEKMKGLNSVPMKVTLKYKNPPISDKSDLVAGIMGYEVHEENSYNGVPSLQPHHCWYMKLPVESKLRERH